jgi:hypothetical protein
MTGPADARSHASTAADAADPFLRERVWAVPFEDVWQAAGRLVSGGLRGWSLVRADDHDGVMQATVRGLGGTIHDVRVEIALDADAQTVLRATVTAQKAGADWGRAGRRLRRFLAALDQAVARVPLRGTAGRSS